MKSIGTLAIASLVALILSVSSFATQTVHGDVDGSVAIGCEFLVGVIDGNTTDTASGADAAAACDGISSTGNNSLSSDFETGGEAETLANALGDENGLLVASDFAAIDLDANQIREFPVTGITTSIYIFAFVDDNGPVTFDADAGLSGSFGPDEICDAPAEDADCDPITPGGGDGVVVATITAASGADAGDQLDVTIIQEGDDDSTETIDVTGAPNEVTLHVVEASVQQSDSTGLADCMNNPDATHGDALSNANSTIAIAVVVDNDGTQLTRIPVGFASSDVDVAAIGKTTGVSVDGGTSGIAAFAVLCGGTVLGTAQLSAVISQGGPNEDTSTQTVTVVGEPATVALAAAPAAVVCDGGQSSTVTATLTDTEGNSVADGTDVNFSVVANADANPINTDTLDGVASSIITPVSGAVGGVTVIVTAGDAQASIRIDCETDGDDPRYPEGIFALPFSEGTSTVGRTHVFFEPDPCGNIGADIWYQLTLAPSPPFDAAIAADTFGSDFSTVIAVYQYTGVGPPPPNLFDSTLIDCNANGADSIVTFDVSAGNTYFIQVGGANGASGALQFNIHCATDPDADCDTVTDATDNCVTSSNVSQINTDSAPIVTAGVVPIDGTVANSDTQGDACDADDDNDGIADGAEPAGCNTSGPLNAVLFDTDGDRTGDAAECVLGSNPGSALSKPPNPMPGDTDRDGLPDALETAIGSNPAVVDTDGDGIHDGIEYRGYNTLPTATDTDGDACPDDTEITDVTGSRKTDIIDIFLIAGSFGMTTSPNLDITKDGNINIVDIFLVAGNLTQSLCPPQ